VIWNDCRVGRLAKNCAWRRRAQGTPGWETSPLQRGVLLGGLSFPLPAGAVIRTRESSKGIAGTTPRRQFDNSGHVAVLMRGLHGSAVPGPRAEAGPCSGILLGRDSEMKILTDGLGRATFMRRGALAVMFVRKHGCALQGSPRLRVVNDGLTVTFYPNRSPMLLTIDAPLGTRVFEP